ncbi:MAG: CPBP family intramembrane glutamic endopeptidase [Cyanobacteriota bacterium]|nr:CPBP family intramembrane glutamic endopeptidase [Cyanobacteriota bacterium]
MSATPPGPSGATSSRGWKGLLALLCLALCGLLWLSGLQQSLERPSVNDALTLRQLELAVQAEAALPPGLAAALGAGKPREALARELRRGVEAKAGEPQPEQTLELALLEGTATSSKRLRALEDKLPPEQRALITTLLRREQDHKGLELAGIELLLAPWPVSPLTRQLVCGQLAAESSVCLAPGGARGALGRWLAVSIGPVLLLLLGSGLLIRELWRRWRGTAPPLPPLQGPPLGLADVTILIAGGFVVLGELLVPQLLIPLVQALLTPLAGRPALAQGLQVLLLYAGLMAAPLLILALLLRPLGRAAVAGSLQWRWRPPGSAVALALSHVLMVLPAVALSGWLVEQLWSNPSGSNPLLELVLSTGDPMALAALAFTATVLAPLFEETLFRGVLLPVLGQRWSPGWSVVVSALTFGLAHLSLGELTPLVVLGLALGWLRLRSGRLAPCVLMHGFWNGLTFLNLVLLA